MPKTPNEIAATIRKHAEYEATTGTKELTTDLIGLSRNWKQNDLVTQLHKDACRVIGERLNEIGGMDAMQTAYHAAHAENRWAGVIQAYWDGVGDWRW